MYSAAFFIVKEQLLSKILPSAVSVNKCVSSKTKQTKIKATTKKECKGDTARCLISKYVRLPEPVESVQESYLIAVVRGTIQFGLILQVEINRSSEARGCQQHGRGLSSLSPFLSQGNHCHVVAPADGRDAFREHNQEKGNQFSPGICFFQLSTSMLLKAVQCAREFCILGMGACIRSSYLPSRQFKIVLSILFSSDLLWPILTDPNNQAFIFPNFSAQLL